MPNLNAHTNWFIRLATCMSQNANALLLGGSPDETISGRAHRMGWRVEKWIDRLFFWDANHCAKAHQQDRIFAAGILGVDLEDFGG